MKFWQKIIIICLGFSSFLRAEETPEANDFLQTKAEENIVKESPKENLKNTSVLSTSTAYFQILADDASSFARIKAVIVQAEKIVSEYFNAPSGLRNKIGLQIISDKDEEFSNQFYVDIYKDGSIYLMLRWDEHLKYDAFCNFIMGAMLRKISLDGRKDKDNHKIAYSLELALSTMLEQRTRNNFMQELAQEANDIKLMPFKDTLNIERGFGDFEQNKLSAFWNLIALNKFYKDKSLLKSNLTQFLINGDTTSLYEKTSKEYRGGDFDKYFRCILNAELSSRLGGIMQAKDSAEELLRLCFIRKDSSNEAFGDKAIFENNQDEEVLAAIDRRIVEIKLLLPFINPIYFNALVSLGEMFEAAYKDDVSDFESARQNFIHYFSQAKYIEARANLLLKDASL